MQDLITTEGPALLGYLAFGAIVAVTAFVAYLAGPTCHDRRRRNRRARYRRHAAKGCGVCILNLRIMTAEDRIEGLKRRIHTAKIEELLDSPVQGGHR